MERLEFDYDYDLADEIESLLENEEDDCLISVYGKYDIIKNILEDLITDGFSIANEIELENYDISHYGKEFVLYVFDDGVNVEKAYRNDGYLYGGGNISFIHEDCSSTLLKYIDSDKIYEFGYADEEDSDDETDAELEHEYTVNGEKVNKETFDEYVSKFTHDLAVKKEDKPFTTSSATYKINGKEVSKDKYESELEKIEGTYLDNMRDMLLGYAEFMDEMNEWRKLFRW